jgi:O-antigen/teichoic acid export membrane protein
MKNKVSNIKNSYYSVIDTLFLPLMMLIATPIFIKSIGIQHYGIWMLINSLIATMSILNIGGVDTIIKYISHYRTMNNHKNIEEIFSTVFVTQLIFMFIVIIFSFFIPDYLINSGFFKIDTIDVNIFLLSFQFGILLFALKLTEQMLFAYFKGFERYDISVKLSISSKFIMISTQLLTVVYGYSLSDIFRNSVISLFIFLIIEILLMKFFYKIPFLFSFKIYRIKELFHFTKWSWVLSIVGVVSSQIDRWMLAVIANMATLGLYSLALLIFTNIHSVISSSVAWIFPKVSKESNTENIKNYFLYLQGLLIISSVSISYILFKADFLFEIWLDEETYTSSIIYIKNILLIIPIYAISVVPHYIIQGKGLIKYNVYVSILSLLVRTLGIYIMYKIYGINGIIISLGISGIVLIVYSMLIIKRKILILYNLKIISIILLPIVYILFILIKNVYIDCLMLIIFIYLYYDTFYKIFKEKTIL